MIKLESTIVFVIATLCLTAIYISAQFRPIQIRGNVVDMEFVGSEVVVLIDLYEMGYSQSGDSARVSGTLIGTLTENKIDTTRYWLLLYDPMGYYGTTARFLYPTSSGVKFLLRYISDVPVPDVKLVSVKNDFSGIVDDDIGWRVLGNWYGSSELTLCDDQTLLASASIKAIFMCTLGQECVKIPWVVDQTAVIDATVGRSIVMDRDTNAWLIDNCAPLEPKMITTPATTSSLHFGAENMILGWTGKQGCWSSDAGVSWTLSDSLSQLQDTQVYRYHHTVDGYDVITQSNSWGPAEPIVYIKAQQSSEWASYALPTDRAVSNIYGDSLSRLYVVLPGNTIAKTDYRPFVWKYDPSVSISDDYANTKVVTQGADTRRIAIRSFKELQNIIDPFEPWTLYSSLGKCMTSSSTSDLRFYKAESGLYLVLQGASIIVVMMY